MHDNVCRMWNYKRVIPLSCFNVAWFKNWSASNEAITKTGKVVLEFKKTAPGQIPTYLATLDATGCSAGFRESAIAGPCLA